MTTKKPAGAAKKKTVKTAGSVRVRSVRDIDRYFSHRETPPIDYTDELGMIREGIHPPFQYRNPTTTTPTGEKRQVGRFEKTEKEREDWSEVHSSEKGPSGGASARSRKAIRHTLIMHFKNTRREKSFVTTRSFNVYPDEVTFIKDKHHDPDRGKVVIKYYYRGNTVHVS